MGHMGGPQSVVLTALKRYITVSVVLVLSACGADTSPSHSILTGDGLQTSQSAVSQPGHIQIQVSPALTPSFDTSIHDYVINCSSSPEVQFTAWLSGAVFLSFVAPGEAASVAPSYPIGYFQKTLMLSAGQRFRFAIGQGTAEYSVRCLPKD